MKKAIEAGKMHSYRRDKGFYEKYMWGNGLDIGYKGLELDPEVEPIVSNAVGIDLDTPSYDGLTLPCADASQNFVFASHILEHVDHPLVFLREWYRVLKLGGHMLLMLPHAYLYERSLKVGGTWGSCLDHKRIYTPASLLKEIPNLS